MNALRARAAACVPSACQSAVRHMLLPAELVLAAIIVICLNIFLFFCFFGLYVLR